MVLTRVAYADFDACCERAWIEWRKDRPLEAAEFGKFMADTRHAGEANRGWSNGKMYKHVGEVPSFVHGIINIHYPGFMRDTPHRDRFFKKSPFCRINDESFTGTKGKGTGIDRGEE